MSYIVKYRHPGLGPRQSSRWGARADAERFAGGLPTEWGANVVESTLYPDIFSHCKGAPAQAISGICPACKRQLTRADAAAFCEG